MKKPLFILLWAMLPAFAFAQQPSYKMPIIIGADGKVVDATGNSVGLVSKDGLIMDHAGHKIAFVDANGNLVDAKTNKKLGKMGKNGMTYYNADGQLEFTLKDNGTTCDIFDAKGKKIGNVHNSFKGSACAIHCFMAQHTHKQSK
ncbi:MAG: hypothetical protein LH606_01510 [Cytophagaceae bacterium]|nr:hypothetical protein [Cytophagaceae bacterium]